VIRCGPLQVQNSLEKCPQDAKVTGSWRNNRHTLIIDLAEIIMDIAAMSQGACWATTAHIRIEAKLTALESIVKKQTSGAADQAGILDQLTALKVLGTQNPPKSVI